MDQLLVFLQPLIEVLAGKHGLAWHVASWLVAANAIRVAAEGFATAVVKATPGTSDDSKLAKFLGSKPYALATKGLEIFSGIKMPKKPDGAKE